MKKSGKTPNSRESQSHSKGVNGGGDNGNQMIRISTNILRHCSEYTLKVLFSGGKVGKSQQKSKGNKPSTSTSGGITNNSNGSSTQIWDDSFEGSDAESFLNMLIPETRIKEEPDPDSGSNWEENMRVMELPPLPDGECEGDKEETLVKEDVILPPPPQFGNESPRMPTLEMEEDVILLDGDSRSHCSERSSTISSGPPELLMGHQWEVGAKKGWFEFQCNQCEKSYDARWKLKKHEKQKHGIILRPYRCNGCNRSYANDWGVKRHIKKFHKGKASFTVDEEQLEQGDTSARKRKHTASTSTDVQENKTVDEDDNHDRIVTAFGVMEYLLDCVELLELYGGGDENYREDGNESINSKGSGDGATREYTSENSQKESQDKNEEIEVTKEIVEKDLPIPESKSDGIEIETENRDFRNETSEDLKDTEKESPNCNACVFSGDKSQQEPPEIEGLNNSKSHDRLNSPDNGGVSESVGRKRKSLDEEKKECENALKFMKKEVDAKDDYNDIEIIDEITSDAESVSNENEAISTDLGINADSKVKNISSSNSQSPSEEKENDDDNSNETTTRNDHKCVSSKDPVLEQNGTGVVETNERDTTNTVQISTTDSVKVISGACLHSNPTLKEPEINVASNLTITKEKESDPNCISSDNVINGQNHDKAEFAENEKDQNLTESDSRNLADFQPPVTIKIESVPISIKKEWDEEASMTFYDQNSANENGFTDLDVIYLPPEGFESEPQVQSQPQLQLQEKGENGALVENLEIVPPPPPMKMCQFFWPKKT